MTKLKPGEFELRWANAIFALLAVIDVLCLLWLHGPQRLMVLALLVALSVLVLWLRERLTQVVRGYRLLQESYEQELSFTRQVMENSTEGLLVVNEQTVITYANKAIADLLGLTPEEMVGKHPNHFIQGDDHTVLATQLRQRWSGEKALYTLHLLHRTGQVIPVSVRGVPRWHQGRIVGQIATVRLLP